MRAGRDRAETERLQAMENGFSVIPHEVNGARGFALRKPGEVRNVETVGNRRETRWSADCGVLLIVVPPGEIESQLDSRFVDHSAQYYDNCGGSEGWCLHLQ